MYSSLSYLIQFAPYHFLALNKLHILHIYFAYYLSLYQPKICERSLFVLAFYCINCSAENSMQHIIEAQYTG